MNIEQTATTTEETEEIKLVNTIKNTLEGKSETLKKLCICYMLSKAIPLNIEATDSTPAITKEIIIIPNDLVTELKQHTTSLSNEAHSIYNDRYMKDNIIEGCKHLLEFLENMQNTLSTKLEVLEMIGFISACETKIIELLYTNK